MRIVKRRRTNLLRWMCTLFAGVSAHAVSVDISTPGGTISIDVGHAGPGGELIEPGVPVDGGFQPPTIFAAPLPVGSGARALGQGGAFTAVADDATAASWNPAGLVQLESPEFSAVYRFSAREDRHEAGANEVEVSDNNYMSSELNYLSLVYPFYLDGLNLVASLNYQETYDYRHEFSARFTGNGAQDLDFLIPDAYRTNIVNVVDQTLQRMTITTEVVTETLSDIDQQLSSSLLSTVDFQQSGTIDAISPALAFNLTPKVSLGLAMNFYMDGAMRGNPIRSELSAAYSGTSDSLVNFSETRNSTTYTSWSGEYETGPPFDPYWLPFSGSQTNHFTDVTPGTRQDQYEVEGTYREENTTEDFRGYNATLGAMWTLGEKLTLGSTVELPWIGKGEQTKTIQHEIVTYDSAGTEVARDQHTETRKSEVTYTYPLYWSLGALWRWSDRLYTSTDVSRTHWSGYSYTADGEKKNPLTGDSYEASSIDDCWSLRLGGEYLYILNWTEIPLRGGLFWEERPALGAPDEYWGFSLGSGISLGREPGRIILDVAYVYEQGNNVMESVLPDRSTSTDSTKHQIFISGIWHF